MKIFQMKSKPHGNERIKEFIDENFICIGWPGIGNLKNQNKDEIRNTLQNKYKISGYKLGNALGQVNTFVNTMKKGDVVLVSEKQWAYIGVIDDYIYEEQFDNEIDAMCHRRKVKWTNKVLIKDLSNDIQKLLSNRNTICQYKDVVESYNIDKVLGKKCFIINDNIDRLDNLISEAIAILEEELRSEDRERRLKAASELIRLKNN